jgi:AcrR family transcriptional regulator
MASNPAAGRRSRGQARRPRYGEGREALLRAAIRVVGRSGLRSLTYRAVACEAGVTHGLVAHHFGSRDALLDEALRYSTRVSIDSSLRSPTDSVRDLASGLVDFVVADPELQAFQFELILESRRRPELRPHVTALYDSYREATVRELARLGIEDEDLARVAFAALDSLVFQQLTVADPEATRRGVAALGALLEAAIETRSRHAGAVA